MSEQSSSKKQTLKYFKLWLKSKKIYLSDIISLILVSGTDNNLIYFKIITAHKAAGHNPYKTK